MAPNAGSSIGSGLRVFLLVLTSGVLLLIPFRVLAVEGPKERIAFGYTAISPVMAGVWMAKETGAFERRGLQVDLIYLRAGPVVVAGLIGGTLHAALGASNSVVAAILNGAPLVAVAGATSTLRWLCGSSPRSSARSSWRVKPSASPVSAQREILLQE